MLRGGELLPKPRPREEGGYSVARFEFGAFGDVFDEDAGVCYGALEGRGGGEGSVVGGKKNDGPGGAEDRGEVHH